MLRSYRATTYAATLSLRKKRSGTKLEKTSLSTDAF